MVDDFYSKTHFARVTKINGSPGEVNELNHYYSVNADVLGLDFCTVQHITNIMVAMPGSGKDGRGLWQLPGVGQLVEVGFVGNSARFPVVRASLPINSNNPIPGGDLQMGIDAKHFVQMKNKNIKIQCLADNIIELQNNIQTLKTDKFFIGKEENFLKIVSTCFDAIVIALNVLAGHTHTETLSVTSPPLQGGTVSSNAGTISAENGKIKNITA